MSVRSVKLAMFKASLREGRGDTSELKQRIASLELEIAEESRLREIEAKRPRRGRPRKKKSEDSPPGPACEPFTKVPKTWSQSEAVAGLLALSHSSSEVCSKHMGFGYEELSQWLFATAMAFEAGDVDAGSFYALGAIRQMRNATTNFYSGWAELGLKAFANRSKHGNRYDDDGELKKGGRRRGRAQFRE